MTVHIPVPLLEQVRSEGIHLSNSLIVRLLRCRLADPRQDLGKVKEWSPGERRGLQLALPLA